jgi:hypothetical protein
VNGRHLSAFELQGPPIEVVVLVAIEGVRGC